MECRVFIPKELILVTRPSNSSITRLLEQQVTVVSAVEIPRGTIFSLVEGSLRCGRLEVYSTLPYDDERYKFGLIDYIIDEGIRRYRKCNWIRFLSFAKSSTNVNIIYTQEHGFHFQITENLPSHTELVLQINSLRNSKHHQNSCFSSLLYGSVLDLSSPLLYQEYFPCIHEDRKSIASSDSGISSSEEFDTSRSPEPISDKKSSKRMLPCNFCGKTFDRPSLLNRHLRTHTGERPHVCDVCDKGFSTSSSLNTHRRIHSGEKPHECATCGKRFTASSNLYYHRMTHVKVKPHKCNLCHKSFPTPGDLKSHMYIHNGSWPHRCSICDRGFSKITNLKNHLFLHTGEKPHKCVVCGKRFALGCNMKAHLKTHADA